MTVEELLSGKTIDYPRTAGINVTTKAAPRVQEDAATKGLFGDNSKPEPVKARAAKKPTAKKQPTKKRR